MNYLNKKTVFSWLTTVSYMALLFYLSSKSSLPKEVSLFNGEDKVLHTGAYFLLTISFIWSYLNTFSKFPLKKILLLSLFSTFLYGISDEIHQYFVPKRCFDILDVLADIIGGIIAIFIVKIYLKSKPIN